MAKGNRGGKRKQYKLEHISVNPNWSYQPDDETDLSDMVKNPIPFVGVGEDERLDDIIWLHSSRVEEKQDYKIEISKLQTLQPFVLKTGIVNYKSWDGSESPFVVELEGKFYLMDGNHRVAKAKLDGKKYVTVTLSRNRIRYEEL